jgi:putative membrane-bound dehydrogenase-like protein
VVALSVVWSLLLLLQSPGTPSASGGRVVATPDGPKAPDGFVVDLVMQHPDVKWPSAVHVREDGSLLVAEDPMDMPGPTDQPLDRIWLLKFAPDGSFTKTLFAEHLYAVMGLQEIDDAIYVMNMPHLTVLRDRDGDGVAEERTELLTNLGPVAPGWPGGFNDHIVSGLRLGMDGFLYVSVGDKGIPHATGTDGSELTLHGGGVVRVRPDGSHLELVANGTRNHLDVCMNEFDEIFTYDNTDDGLGWWTRFSHVMPTGYYGYPFDYHDHTDRMLPCMRDDGGGSGVGGLVYREDAWPAEYRGDVFCCDWAKRTIRRYKVERAGATFNCVLHEDWITPGKSGEFRPLDIAESPDGRFVYVADWNFDGWTQPTEAGRVWRIGRADGASGTPPFGSLHDKDMSVSSLAHASLGDLVANLDHPGFQRRIAAQRELARRLAKNGGGDDGDLGAALRVCKHALHDESTSARARRHLVWAIDMCDTPTGDLELISTLRDPSAEVRAQAARALGEGTALELEKRRELVLPPSRGDELAKLVVADPDLVVRREAAIAIGRSGDASQLPQLVRALDASDDLFLRFAIRQAIRALPCDWSKLVRELLPAASPRAQEDLWLAMHELYDARLVDELWREIKDHENKASPLSTAQRARALAVLAQLHRKAPPWDGKWWQTQPAKNPPPAKTVEWEGTKFVIAAIDDAFHSNDAELRAAAIEAARTTREPALVRDVVDALGDERDVARRVQLIELLTELDVADPAPFRAAIVHVDPRVRVAGIVALEKRLGAQALADVEPRLADEDATVRAAAVDCFARHPDAERLDVYLRGLALGGSTRDLCRAAITTLRAAVRPALEAKAAHGELDAAALAAVREIYDEPQPLLHWKLVGPFPRKTHVAALESAATPDAAEYEAGRLAERTSDANVDAPAAALVAVEAALPHGFVDLRAKLAAKNDVVAYALAVVDSPGERTARCTLGSDDGATLWLNGTKLFEFGGDRAWAPDQDRVALPLVAGRNALLLRVEQAGGDWSFDVKVNDGGRGPLFEGVGTTTAAAPTSPNLEYDVAKWRDYALANHGDAARGHDLFFASDGPGCFRCHAVAGVGPKIGPDLRDVGAKYARAELVTSVLEPSQRILDGYAASNVFLKDGDVLTGLVVGEADGVLKLADSNGVVRQIALADVKERRVSKLSAMPTGLAEKLTREQLADVVAWLETLKK